MPIYRTSGIGNQPHKIEMISLCLWIEQVVLLNHILVMPQPQKNWQDSSSCLCIEPMVLEIIIL